MKHKIFVVDDEPELCENIARLLKSPDTDVETFTHPEEALSRIALNPPDLVLLDIRMPSMSGEEFFQRCKKCQPFLPVVFLTAYGSVAGAVLAIKSGAFDYLEKPFNKEHLRLVVQRAIEHGKLLKEVQRLEERLEESGEVVTLKSQNPKMQAIIQKAMMVAHTDATVLITGESGVGKEVLARYIHDQSRYRAGPFVVLDCLALQPSLMESELFGYEKGAFTGADRRKIGLIESASQGTLFVDEIGDLPLTLQTKLFRFLETREIRRIGGVHPMEVDCRVVCATNRDLKKLVKEGRFREELFYRISIVTLHIPPLRERGEDIIPLAKFFLKVSAKKYRKSPVVADDFFQKLKEKRWNGNIRELKNFIERLVIFYHGGTLDLPHHQEPEQEALTIEDFPPTLTQLSWHDAKGKLLKSFSSFYAKALLDQCMGNISEAAKKAGVDRKTFYKLLKDP